MVVYSVFPFILRFIKGYGFRNDPECDENREFIKYTKMNFLERLKKSCPKSVLDKSWIKAPKLLEEVCITALTN